MWHLKSNSNIISFGDILSRLAQTAHTCALQACSSVQSCVTLCDPLDYSLLRFSVLGVFQVRILDWVAVSSSRVSSQPRDQTCFSCLLHCRQIFHLFCFIACSFVKQLLPFNFRKFEFHKSRPYMDFFKCCYCNISWLYLFYFRRSATKLAYCFDNGFHKFKLHNKLWEQSCFA